MPPRLGQQSSLEASKAVRYTHLCSTHLRSMQEVNPGAQEPRAPGPGQQGQGWMAGRVNGYKGLGHERRLREGSARAEGYQETAEYRRLSRRQRAGGPPTAPHSAAIPGACSAGVRCNARIFHLHCRNPPQLRRGEMFEGLGPRIYGSVGVLARIWRYLRRFGARGVGGLPTKETSPVVDAVGRGIYVMQTPWA